MLQKINFIRLKEEVEAENKSCRKQLINFYWSISMRLKVAEFKQRRKLEKSALKFDCKSFASKMLFYQVKQEVMTGEKKRH